MDLVQTLCETGRLVRRPRDTTLWWRAEGELAGKNKEVLSRMDSCLQGQHTWLDEPVTGGKDFRSTSNLFHVGVARWRAEGGQERREKTGAGGVDKDTTGVLSELWTTRVFFRDAARMTSARKMKSSGRIPMPSWLMKCAWRCQRRCGVGLAGRWTLATTRYVDEVDEGVAGAVTWTAIQMSLIIEASFVELTRAHAVQMDDIFMAYLGALEPNRRARAGGGPCVGKGDPSPHRGWKGTRACGVPEAATREDGGVQVLTSCLTI